VVWHNEWAGRSALGLDCILGG